MDQIKIIFEHEGGTESLWATPSTDGFIIDSYPLYLKGICYQDIVDAELVERDVFRYVKTLSKSENSLYRVFYRSEKEVQAASLLQNIKALGCSYEGLELNQAHLLAINIPAQTDANAVWEILKNGLDEGIWEVQEGEDRHPEVE